METIEQAKIEYSDFSKDDFILEIVKLKSNLTSLQHFLFHTGKECSLSRGDIYNAEQPGLFNEAEDLAIQDEPEASSDEDQSDVKPHRRRRGRRLPLPKDLPRHTEVNDISDEDKVCKQHGTPLEKIGESSVEKLKLVPAKILVTERKTPKYKCPSCEQEMGKAEIISAPTPADIIPKSFASPELLAYIVTSKYEDHLPLYRQEKIFMRYGVDLTRGTMARWMIQCANKATPLINLMNEDAVSRPVIHIDETVLQVLKEAGRKPEQKSYIWVYGANDEKPFVRFCYYSTRGKTAASEILDDFKGVAVCDAYKAYDAAAKDSDFTLAACLAHVRRKFFLAEKDAKKAKVPSKKILASQAMAFIRKLYKIERQFKDQSPEKRLAERQEKSLPILAGFRLWLDDQSTKVIPKSSLGKAISYALGIWDKLQVFTTDGRISIDNNWVEALIRNFVVGRKNWTFSDTPQGAEASATLYTLVESAKLNGLSPFDYLSVIFKELPKAKTLADYEKLLPYNINKHYHIAPYLSPHNKAASTT
ncbi:MAG: IS66 family transposase [Saprospiraceae bacterium]